MSSAEAYKQYLKGKNNRRLLLLIYKLRSKGRRRTRNNYRVSRKSKIPQSHQAIVKKIRILLC